jgi:hypothetical protein
LNNFFGIFVGCTLALANVAGADVQKCMMNIGKNSQGDMIATEIYLMYDDSTKTMQVMDNIISYFNKEQPVQARISAEKDVSRTFDWAVFMVNSAGQRTKMQYHATLFHAKKEIHVMARPVGFNNTFSSVGKCAPYNS